MYAFCVNHNKQDAAATGRRPRGRLFHIGFFLHHVPRLLLGCRLFGHRPVVDGTGGWRTNPDGERYGNPNRWVVCDRCGTRSEPQGQLDADAWHIGDRYTGPRMPEAEYLVRLKLQRHERGRARWPRKQRGWTVEWETLGAAIPERGPAWQGSGIHASAVPVGAQEVRAGTWPDVAAAAIAAKVTAGRTRRGWSPVGLVPVDITTDTVVPQPQERAAA